MEITGILHAHSRYSYDAKLTLSELRALCLSRGIRFMCMTEHTDLLTKENADAFVRECETLSDSEFLFIPGFEVPYKHAHVLMIGSRTFRDTYAPTIDALRAWAADAACVILAHPVRNQFIVESGLLALIHGIEVWNQQYEGKRVPRVRSLTLFAELHRLKPSLIATGGVDLHRTEHFGAPLVTLDCDTFTEAHIIEKLKMGAFTVSSERAQIYGTLPDAAEVARRHRFESHFSVFVIVCGKFVNKVLKALGLSLPSSLKTFIRKRL